MLKRKLTLAILAISIIPSACAALSVTTWIVQQGSLVHGADTKTFLEAQGYRCYSLADDTAWREELKLERACCESR